MVRPANAKYSTVVSLLLVMDLEPISRSVVRAFLISIWMNTYRLVNFAAELNAYEGIVLKIVLDIVLIDG